MQLFEMFSIDESFDHIPDLKWEGYDGASTYGGSYNAKFTVHGEGYVVSFDEGGDPAFKNNVWAVAFRQLATAGYKPTGNMGTAAIVVMGGVVEAIRQFAQKHNPPALGLLGKDSEGLGKLYKIMAGKLRGDVTAMGFQVGVGSYEGSTVVMIFPAGEDMKSFLSTSTAA
jgi:hypothetical protein